MGIEFSRDDFKKFSEYIEKNYGIVIKENKSYIMKTKIGKLIQEYGFNNPDEFLYRLKEDETFEKLVIDNITVNETRWFRDGYPWDYLYFELMPIYIDMFRNGERDCVFIWSAATSTGEEAYSISICIKSYLDNNNIEDISLENFYILATDISEKAINYAKNAVYTQRAIGRGIIKEYKDKYFLYDNNRWVLKKELVDSVVFKNFNLLDNYDFDCLFDLVFYRNILIYFNENVRMSILKKLVNVLNDGAILFFGAPEVFLEEDKSYGLHKMNYESNVYYKKGKLSNFI